MFDTLCAQTLFDPMMISRLIRSVGDDALNDHHKPR